MKTTSGNFEFKNGELTHLTDEIEFNDYIELIETLVGGDVGIYDGATEAMLHYAYEEMREWDWRESPIFSGVLSDMWAEAEWFQAQANHLFDVDDWREIDDWKTFSSTVYFSPNFDGFGEA